MHFDSALNPVLHVLGCGRLCVTGCAVRVRLRSMVLVVPDYLYMLHVQKPKPLNLRRSMGIVP